MASACLVANRFSHHCAASLHYCRLVGETYGAATSRNRSRSSTCRLLECSGGWHVRASCAHLHSMPGDWVARPIDTICLLSFLLTTLAAIVLVRRFVRRLWATDPDSAPGRMAILFAAGAFVFLLLVCCLLSSLG